VPARRWLDDNDFASTVDYVVHACRLVLDETGLLPHVNAGALDRDELARLTDEWLEAHRTAHAVGLRSNVTIMFGAVERPVHGARHLLRTATLQRETGGFTEFVGLPFVHMAAPIYLKRAARRGPTWREVVLMHAVARIVYNGLIDNIQASWVKLGADGSANSSAPASTTSAAP